MVDNGTSLDGGNSTGGDFDVDRLFYSFCVFSLFFIVVGTPLCAWLVSAILTSPEMRRRLRNQLVCTLCLCFVANAIVCSVFEVFHFMSIIHRHYDSYPCRLLTAMRFLRMIIEFASSWLTVGLVAVFLAQVSDLDPTTTLTPRAATLGKVTLLTLPFVVGGAVVSAIGTQYKPQYFGNGCINISQDNFLVFVSVDLGFPMVVIVALMAVAAVRHYYRREKSSSSGSMRMELINTDNSRVDNLLAYIVVVVIDCLCRLPMALSVIEMGLRFTQAVTFEFVGAIIGDARIVLVPWGWLLLEDVRERVKTWRPWYRPGPGIDLAVTYRSGRVKL